MEWRQGKGKSSTGSGAATQAPLVPGFDPSGAAARGQSAELIDTEIQVDYAIGAAKAKTVGATPAQRRADEARVAAEITASMRKAGVPPAQVVFGETPGYGHFDRKGWRLIINGRRFHDPKYRVRILGTVYHEARHAEQYFDAIRVAAALMPGASTAALARWIQRKGSVVPPMHIIDAARRQPTQSGESRRWFTLYFGVNAQVYREAQFAYKLAVRHKRDIEAEGRRLARRDRVPSAVTARFEAEKARATATLLHRYKAYRALADEADAHDQTDVVIEMIEDEP